MPLPASHWTVGREFLHQVLAKIRIGAIGRHPKHVVEKIIRGVTAEVMLFQLLHADLVHDALELLKSVES